MEKKSVAERLAQACARGKPGKTCDLVVTPASVAKLPAGGKAMRVLPNAFLRGALFGVSKVRKTYKKRTVIATLRGQEIRFLGTCYNQTDLDLWMELVHMASRQVLQMKVEFTANALLKSLDRRTAGSDHEKLKEDMARLKAGAIEITWTKEQKTFAGSLIQNFCRDEATGKYVVIFDSGMVELYGNGDTHLDHAQRRALGQNSLAKWLHGVYSTHAKPYPYRVSTLLGLSGSGAVLKSFKQKLKAALDMLKEVGSIQFWEIDEDDLVRIQRKPSVSQTQHLAKKARTKQGGW